MTDVMTGLELGRLIENIDTRLAVAQRQAPALPDRKAEARERLTRYVLMKAGECRLAVSIDGLAEVGPLPPMTRLPNLPGWILGIVNIRGEVVSVIDLPGFLQVGECGAVTGNRFAVLRYQRRKVAILLESIDGTVARAPESRLPAPPTQSALEQHVFPAVLNEDDRSYSILDTARLLTSGRLLDYNRQD